MFSYNNYEDVAKRCYRTPGLVFKCGRTLCKHHKVDSQTIYQWTGLFKQNDVGLFFHIDRGTTLILANAILSRALPNQCCIAQKRIESTFFDHVDRTDR